MSALIAVVWLRARLAVGDEQARVAQRRIAELEERAAQLEGERAAIQEQLGAAERRSTELATRLEEQQQHAADKFETLQRSEERLREQFKALAGEALDRNAKRLGEQQQERLEHLLNPLRDRIRHFEQQVVEARKAEHGDRERLRGELQKLYDLNQRMTDEANNLTKALRGESKTRGDWGEMILAGLLERSGLEEGREYELQQHFTGPAGERLRPDVVVHLPESRCLIIDSKVQLESWARYCEAEDEGERVLAAKALVAALRSHVRDLAGKRYHDLPGSGSPDFSLMFVPIEPAFACAVRHDPALFQDAFDQHVVLVSPTTLLATLSTVANIWRYERQNRHALQIAERAGKLYDKFVGFAEDLDEIGNRIRQTQDAHAAAVNKLRSGRGNLVRQAEQVRQLGAKAAKKLGVEWTADAADDEGDAEDEDGGRASETPDPPRAD